MLLDWTILFLLIIHSIISAVNGKRLTKSHTSNRSLFYLKDIIVSVALLLLFLLIKPSLYFPLNLFTINRGIKLSEEIISSIYIIFFSPLVLSLTPWTDSYLKDTELRENLFGFPVSYLPNSLKSYIIFIIYIVSGVFFEELLYRQFLFHSLYTTLQITGDNLILISSLLFSLIHVYQGWKGLLSNFILGLLLGKIFLLEMNLIYPIVFHLSLNLSLVVLTYKKLKGLNRTTE